MDKIIEKWYPVINNTLGYKNIKVINIICIYCEWFMINDQNNKLSEKIIEIKKKIKNIDSENKVEIVGKFLNPYSGLIEYKLADGRYIDKYDIKIDITNEDVVELFGEDFFKYYSIKDYRDVKLDKLII